MDNQLKNKLTRFEAPPPEGAWQKIVERLEEDQHYAARLYNYTQNPPGALWAKIEAGLDAEKKAAKVIPFTTRFRTPIRYTAEASVIAVILISATLLFKRTEAGAIQAGSDETVPTSPQVVVTPAIRKNNFGPVDSSLTVVPTYATETEVENSSRFKQRLLQLIQPQTIAASLAISGRFIPKKATTKPVCNNEILQNYMVCSNGKGMAIRVPKKLFSLVQCDDNDPSCEQRIKTLQQKMATASVSADFGGVVEMLRQVGQKP
jgi:hypothetical protein